MVLGMEGLKRSFIEEGEYDGKGEKDKMGIYRTCWSTRRASTIV